MSPRPSGADSVPASWSAEQHIAVAERRSAHNYHPLPVVIAHGEGAWVTDVAGRRYLDCLAGYSAVNFGHRNPELLAAARAQLDRITLTSRAFHHDRFAPFVAALADLVGKEQVLPVNTGAEAVETGIKIARKWGYEVKGVPDGRAVIVVASGNFHGRTTTIVSFSTDPAAYRGFGPPTPGFRIVPYGDAAALADAIDADTVAVLVEPVQGEAGVIVPPADYLPRVRDLCTRAGILLIADEVQSGLGRTGTVRACDHSGVDADIYLFGKALGGGILPVAAAVGDAEVFDVIRPGQHGSTFGGNALACAVGTAVVGLVRDGPYLDHVRALAPVLRARLDQLVGNGVVAARSIGLWAGIDVDPTLATGRELCERLLQRGVLVKDTHGSTIRLSPPLVITEDELHWAVDQIAAVLADLRAGR
ncbi:ornithine--oxo-acid transaminase [Thermobifida fusca]|jgi:ornithine--oxo-acid transaminase|uniref:ornithine aminotransferase n=1 Tax=Thermobifida fusca TM51 TaxID=1169414 RepID=A0A9P2TAL4_THEFU|nr:MULTISPECIES: ornithine--oxo-acid transaminase [Thermobifida]EOR70731.1 aminotransferase [Thermobifida fusca TM51]MBO2530353.1 ornithine--oxo-acid transaminase [Thermobifida sp.]PPS95869.1 ornithine--oxo-acid aminotransferase [Thermobifida fusca]PZN62560.1 MAG: ornithine--oxo-acid transaminase [Thermobifida fusca]